MNCRKILKKIVIFIDELKFFKFIFEKFPSIESANHSCGLGKTFDEINQLIPGKVYPYQNYKDWLDKIKKSKVTLRSNLSYEEFIKKISQY